MTAPLTAPRNYICFVYLNTTGVTAHIPIRIRTLSSNDVSLVPTLRGTFFVFFDSAFLIFQTGWQRDKDSIPRVVHAMHHHRNSKYFGQTGQAGRQAGKSTTVMLNLGFILDFNDK